MRRLFVLSLLVWLAGCADSIPDYTFQLNDKQEEKLNLLGSIEVYQASFFDMKCGIHDRNLPGSTGYYILSSNTSMMDDYAMWGCGGIEFAYLNCPSMTLTIKSSNVYVQASGGTVDDYSFNDIEHCTYAAIDKAPMVTRATRESVVNRDSHKAI